MKRTETQLAKLAMAITNYNPKATFVEMFIEGFRFCELDQFTLVKPKPHVAEVVKCGDINKKSEREKLIFNLARRNPTKSPEEIIRKVNKIFDGMTNEQLVEDYNLKIKNQISKTRQRLIDINKEVAELGMTGSRKDITDMVTKCEHEPNIETISWAGYKCIKCNHWINY